METEPVKQRMKFILEWERRWNEGEGVVNMSQLCRVFGVSRQTGYKWVCRYRDADHDIRVMEEQSRRPHRSPHAIRDEIQDVVVEARKLHPRWGPRKLKRWLEERSPEVDWPSASAMGEILRRRGLTRPVRRRRRAVPSAQPFERCDRPNATWCIDFKGKFRLEDGNWCHVLTLVDAYSRYLLRSEALLEPNGRLVERVCDSAFLEFGLPKAMRSDNGPPFASTGPGGLSALSVWWLKLGIRLERIQPGKPQQNGRQERLHRTLEEVVAAPARDVRAQQRALDDWRREYNEERPHEALGQRPPLSAYERSHRTYPRPSIRLTAPAFCDEVCLDRNGCLRIKRRKLRVSSALAYEHVFLDRFDGRRWEVSYGPILLGHFDLERLDRGLIRKRARKRPPSEVSTMSLDQ